MFFAHETHDVEPDAFATPHVVPYWAWTMATRMVLRLMSMTSGTMTIIGTARPNTVAPFTRPCPPFPVLSAIGPSHHQHAYCNPFHADTGGADADNQRGGVDGSHGEAKPTRRGPVKKIVSSITGQTER